MMMMTVAQAEADDNHGDDGNYDDCVESYDRCAPGVASGASK